MRESGEMYLENILILKQKLSNVRAVDLAEMMGYSKASISRALSRLKNDGFVALDESGYLLLTEKGAKIAETIYERHRVITDMLVAIGVDEKTAAADACKMEHDISEKTFRAMKKHIIDKR